MITKRIIPCLDIDKGRVVKGTNFVDIKDAGDPVELAKRYADSGADELVFLDITASSDKRVIIKDLVKKVAKEIFIPFTVGGGIDSVDLMQEILDLGADKISLNTAALRTPNLIKEASDHFGSQCVVVAVDIKRVLGAHSNQTLNVDTFPDLASNDDSICEVYSHGGRNNLGVDALKWILLAESLGAGEILLTSMDRDGTNDGYDIDMLKKVKSLVKIPIIASGGAGSIAHIYQALLTADAALLASLLHFNKLTIPQIKSNLNRLNIMLR